MNACSERCGWCSRCTAAWEREPEDDVEPDLDIEADRLAIRDEPEGEAA